MVHTEFFWVLALVRKVTLSRNPGMRRISYIFVMRFLLLTLLTHMLFLKTNCVTGRF